MKLSLVDDLSNTSLSVLDGMQVKSRNTSIKFEELDLRNIQFKTKDFIAKQ